MSKNTSKRRHKTGRSSSRCADCGQTFNARDVTATDRGRLCRGCHTLTASPTSDVDVAALVASMAEFRGDKAATRQRRYAEKRRRRDE